MSIKTMNRVWSQSEQKGSALLLLLAIADNADENGECWPGIHLLAEKTRMSERQTQRLVQYLSTTRELAVEWNAGRGSSNYYYILVGLPETQITYIKGMVDQKNRERGFEEWVKKISEACKDAAKGDKMTPIETGKGDNLSPQNEEKGVISDGKGDKFCVKGDIAMSPEPLNLKNQRKEKEEPEESGANPHTPSTFEAWQMVLGQLRPEMNRADYETWVQPLKPISRDGPRVQIGAINAYGRDWVATRLGSRITRLLESAYQQPVQVEFILITNP